MTHDELLAKINRPQGFAINVNGMGSMIEVQHLLEFRNALRAIVELHRPYKYEGRFNSYLRCSNCYSPDESEGNLYPCETIQAIEKELNIASL